MNFKIQRVPRALNSLLNVSGGATPTELLDAVRGTVDLLQLYGASQLQTRTATNAALAEGGNLTITIPTNETWILFSATMLIAKTATMTALRAALFFGVDAANLAGLASQELGPFGATETGAVRVVFYAPYPRILFPGMVIAGQAEIIGTDATCSAFLTAQVGILQG